jgi:hypothetical protein
LSWRTQTDKSFADVLGRLEAGAGTLENENEGNEHGKSEPNVLHLFRRRKKTTVVLRRELEHLGGCAHHETLGPARGTDHGRIDGGYGAHIRIGWNTDERRLDTVWEAVVLPPGPRAIDWGWDVATGAGCAGCSLRRATPTTTDEDEDDEKGQYDNDGLHLYRL